MAPRHGTPPQGEKYEESAGQESPEAPQRHRLALESSTTSESEVIDPFRRCVDGIDQIRLEAVCVVGGDGGFIWTLRHLGGDTPHLTG